MLLIISSYIILIHYHMMRIIHSQWDPLWNRYTDIVKILLGIINLISGKPLTVMRSVKEKERVEKKWAAGYSETVIHS